MNNFKKIYTADYSVEGFHDGVLDGKNSRPKNVLKIIRQVHTLNYFWKFNRAYQTYTESYHKGYDDGQRVRESIFQNSINQSCFYHKEMNNMDYYEQHISAIQNSIDDLTFIISMFDQSLDLYNLQINNAGKAGLLKNYVDQLKINYNDLDKQKKVLTGYLKRLIKKLIECQDTLREAQKVAEKNDGK